MKTYIGTKVIKAQPMTKQAYCDYRGWKVPENEDPTEEIYLVEYPEDPTSTPNHPDHKGYISMSPKTVFEKAYKEIDGLVSFAIALQALKDGNRAQRIGWNGAGLFVFKQVHSDISMSIVPGMQSLPQSVKDEFVRRHMENEEKVSSEGGQDVNLKSIRYRNQFCIVYPNNTIFSWVPSANDICADDWAILD